MILIQVVAKDDEDVYKLLRHKVTHEARTWSWAKRSKTRLQHARLEAGYIEVASAESVLVAQFTRSRSRTNIFSPRNSSGG